jgi:hypothetical protein
MYTPNKTVKTKNQKSKTPESKTKEEQEGQSNEMNFFIIIRNWRSLTASKRSLKIWRSKWLKLKSP